MEIITQSWWLTILLHRFCVEMENLIKLLCSAEVPAQLIDEMEMQLLVSGQVFKDLWLILIRPFKSQFDINLLYLSPGGSVASPATCPNDFVTSI